MTETIPSKTVEPPTTNEPTPVTDDPSSDLVGLAWSVVPTPFGDVLRAVALTGSEGYRPAPTDILDSPGAYRIRAELPGVPKAGLDLVVKGSSLEIHGELPKEP